MNKYYATLGQSHTHRVNGVTLDCDSLLEVEAETYDQAYSYCQELFEGQWCSLYDKPDLDLYPRGVVLKIVVPITGCPYDTNGDGDCGRSMCPICHPEKHT